MVKQHIEITFLYRVLHTKRSFLRDLKIISRFDMMNIFSVSFLPQKFMSADHVVVFMGFFFNSCFEIIYFIFSREMRERQIFYVIKYSELITAQNVMRKIFSSLFCRIFFVINSFQLFIFFKLSALKTSLSQTKYVYALKLNDSFHLFSGKVFGSFKCCALF